MLYQIVRAAFHHKGFSFVRILQRCPEWLPEHFEPYVKDPKRTLLLSTGTARVSEAVARTYSNNRSTIRRTWPRRARSRRSSTRFPVGILYRNPAVPCYEDLRRSDKLRTADFIRAGLEAEFDKFTIWPCTQN